MAVVYSNTLKNTRMSAVVAAIDAGAASGVLHIYDALYANVLATFNLDKPSFSEANQQIALIGCPLNVLATANGTAANARFSDSNGNVVIDGLTVGTAAADIILDSVALVTGETVTVASGIITHG